MNNITYEYLIEYFHYDPITGIFYRKKLQPFDRKNKIGIPVGNISNSGGKLYLVIQVLGKKYKLHRLAFLYMTGKLPDQEVDHIDGNGLNNKWLNLRDVSHQVNGLNTKLSIRNTSGFKGVSWYPRYGKWIAYITVNKKRKTLGYYSNIEDAIKVRLDSEEGVFKTM